jgi:hypothetical protein
LERLLLERNRLSEILAKRKSRADPRSIQEGSSDTAVAASADLQGAVKFRAAGLMIKEPDKACHICSLDRLSFISGEPLRIDNIDPGPRKPVDANASP